MQIGGRQVSEAKVFDGSAGYHQFKAEDGEPYGSLEVFWHEAYSAEDAEDWPSGWYWAAGFPGCLHDGEPCGPFGSSHRALADAMGE